ncbi:15-hydroxyprostaglandin dehydrogenase [NAD(+)] isoform X2 [Oryzias melastigma]|uniref:15-hydroxyprostaglandin dehydrogenase [NAD(+)] isoform X2 n=1 Tax=Oryzias melastigma TaxID=30732 RepID=UPI000CF8076B|nr:15-hydroxyprostaglandin dehydrogenase [NAD(+)] isoform X2 [Oryzias melastigma]
MALMGRVALVTGGAQGIGRAVVEALLRSAAKVSVVDINQNCGDSCKSELDAEFGGGSCAFIQCDVTDGDALRDAFQKTADLFGHLDIVINNAGINNEKNWEKTIGVNLTSVIKGTYLGLEHMSREYGKPGGTIINVSSMAAFMHSPHQPVYTATKHGVIGFTRAMADASVLGNYGVRINVLCPAFVDTPLLQSVEEEDNMGKFVKFKEDFKRSMDKFGVLQPSLIAEGMMRLITDTALNGAVMKITCSKGIHFHTYEPMSAGARARAGPREELPAPELSASCEQKPDFMNEKTFTPTNTRPSSGPAAVDAPRPQASPWIFSFYCLGHFEQILNKNPTVLLFLVLWVS